MRHLSPVSRYAITALLVALLGDHAATADELVEVQLSTEQRQRLTQAPAAHLNSPPSTLLKQALAGQGVPQIRADAEGEGTGTIQGWIDYAPIQISEGRTYHPRVVCLANGDEVEWEHCQDESYSLAHLPSYDKPIMVSENVDNGELQRILDFVKTAELESPKNTPVQAAGVYQVVKYRVSGNIGVFATTPAKDEWTEVFLQPTIGADGAGTYEITESPGN